MRLVGRPRPAQSIISRPPQLSTCLGKKVSFLLRCVSRIFRSLLLNECAHFRNQTMIMSTCLRRGDSIGHASISLLHARKSEPLAISAPGFNNYHRLRVCRPRQRCPNHLDSHLEQPEASPAFVPPSSSGPL